MSEKKSDAFKLSRYLQGQAALIEHHIIAIEEIQNHLNGIALNPFWKFTTEDTLRQDLRKEEEQLANILTRLEDARLGALIANLRASIAKEDLENSNTTKARQLAPDCEDYVVYVLEEIRMADNGNPISDGFYGGPSKKYAGVFNMVPSLSGARPFGFRKNAEAVAGRLNRKGYNFVVKPASMVCLEVKDLSLGDDGRYHPGGIRMLHEGVTEKSYEEFSRSVKIPEVLRVMGLSGIVDPANVKVISPAEYDAKYAGKEG